MQLYCKHIIYLGEKFKRDRNCEASNSFKNTIRLGYWLQTSCMELCRSNNLTTLQVSWSLDCSVAVTWWVSHDWLIGSQLVLDDKVSRLYLSTINYYSYCKPTGELQWHSLSTCCKPLSIFIARLFFRDETNGTTVNPYLVPEVYGSSP
jgi:hypothetical protein